MSDKFTIEEKFGYALLTTEHQDAVLVAPSDKVVGLSILHRHGLTGPPILLSLAESEALVKLLGKANAKLRGAAARV